MKTDQQYQVVILAGGASSRFFPFSDRRKARFLLMGKPLPWFTLQNLSKMGVRSATVVRAKEKDQIEHAIGKSVGPLNVHFVPQQEPKGQADALLTAWKTLAHDQPILVLNAHHFTASSILSNVLKHWSNMKKSVVAVTKTDMPWKYGMVQVAGQQVTKVVEKPKKGEEPSNLRIVGIYFLTPDAIDVIASRPETEYQLEDGLDELAKKRDLAYVEIDQPMPTLKYPWDLFSIKDMLLEGKQYIDKSAFVHKTALIEGPCWIGPNAVVGAFSLLRKGVILEEGAQVERHADIKNSIIGKNSHVHSGFVGDSVIGESCRIGAGFITANRRFDRRNILVEVKGEKVDTGVSSLGVFVGDNTHIGIHCGTMPGTIIESGAMVMPGDIVKGIVKAAHSP